MSKLLFHEFHGLLHLRSCSNLMRHRARRVEVPAAVDVLDIIQVGNGIGVIPYDRFQQALESFPVRSMTKFLFIEVGETGVEGEDLIMLPTALVTQIARREFEIIGIVSLREARLWRDMVY